MCVSVLPAFMNVWILPSEIKRGSQIPLELKLKVVDKPPCRWWVLTFYKTTKYF